MDMTDELAGALAEELAGELLTEVEREERTGIRLTAADRARLRQIAIAWYPGEQRKQSQAMRRLIREQHARLFPASDASAEETTR